MSGLLLAHPPFTTGAGHAECLQCCFTKHSAHLSTTAHGRTQSFTCGGLGSVNIVSVHSTVVAFRSGIGHLLTRPMPVKGRCDSSPSAPGGPFGALGLPSALLSPEGMLRLVGAICLFIRSCLPIRTCPVRVILIHIACASPEPLQVSLLLPTAALCICPQQGIPKTTKTVTAHLHVSRHGQQGCLPLQAGDCMCY